MKHKELYLGLIKINKTTAIQIDTENYELLNIFHEQTIREKFKLNRKIYTLFKVIQEYTNDCDYVVIEDINIKIYGNRVPLYNDIYLQINPNRACLTLDFYNQNHELIFLTKLIYNTQRLFTMFLIPVKLKTEKNYYIRNIFKFIDMIELISYEKNKMLNNINGDNMKNRELYTEIINLTETYALKIDDNKNYVNIYQYQNLREQFSLKRRIYTFFKLLQSYIQSDKVIIGNNNDKLYGEKIHFTDNLFMQLSDKHETLMVEFYRYESNNNELLYTVRTNYMTQKLFSIMLIPNKVKENPHFLIDPQDFKELMDILSVIKF